MCMHSFFSGGGVRRHATFHLIERSRKHESHPGRGGDDRLGWTDRLEERWSELASPRRAGRIFRLDRGWSTVVYDLDDPSTPSAVVEEVSSSGNGAAFGPDTLAEARNRNYKAYKPR